MTEVTARDISMDRYEIGHPSVERARAASEVGAAIAHQLSGPMTALLLYVGDLNRNSDRFPATDGESLSLKQIAANAFREAKRIGALIEQIGDASVAPLQTDATVSHGREVISWWSHTAAGGRGVTNGSDLSPAASANSSYALLTPREREVLSLVSQGLSNKEGAIRMEIGPRTFESHRARIMRKFKARNAADLVRMALQTPAVPADSGSAHA
jgi:DNA-binding CsgD family transcriptional regulator